MPRDIQIGPHTVVRRSRCHLGHKLELFVIRKGAAQPGKPPPLAPVEIPPGAMGAHLRELVNFAGRLAPLSDELGDDPILHEAGTLPAPPGCCRPSARVYLHESDRAIIAERVAYGEATMAALGMIAPDPVTGRVAAVRHALIYTTKGAIDPREFVHAVELVYLPDGAPWPKGGQFELLDPAAAVS